MKLYLLEIRSSASAPPVRRFVSTMNGAARMRREMMEEHRAPFDHVRITTAHIPLDRNDLADFLNDVSSAAARLRDAKPLMET